MVAEQPVLIPGPMGSACSRRREEVPSPAEQGEEELEDYVFPTPRVQHRWTQLLRHALWIRRQQRYWAYLGHHLNRHLNKRLRDRLKSIYLKDGDD